ncbi:MAG TPA: hypothetical protein VJ183_11425 [Chloroflexia bacterium]|nr:hypothetical protein [Chloroflexia bacterium]
MADTTIKDEIVQEIDRLPPAMQRRVLDFARNLANPLPPGVPGKDLLQFGGFLTDEEADAMLQAIEEGCEQVYPSEWVGNSEW